MRRAAGSVGLKFCLNRGFRQRMGNGVNVRRAGSTAAKGRVDKLDLIVG